MDGRNHLRVFARNGSRQSEVGRKSESPAHKSNRDLLRDSPLHSIEQARARILETGSCRWQSLLAGRHPRSGLFVWLLPAGEHTPFVSRAECPDKQSSPLRARPIDQTLDTHSCRSARTVSSCFLECVDEVRRRSNRNTLPTLLRSARDRGALDKLRARSTNPERRQSDRKS